MRIRIFKNITPKHKLDPAHVRSKACRLHDCHDDWCGRIWARKIHTAAPQELIFSFKLCGGSVTRLRNCRRAGQSVQLFVSGASKCNSDAKRFMFRTHGLHAAVRLPGPANFYKLEWKNKKRETPWDGPLKGDCSMAHVSTVAPLHFVLTEGCAPRKPSLLNRFIAAMMQARQRQMERRSPITSPIAAASSPTKPSARPSAGFFRRGALVRRPNAIHQLGDLKKMTTLPLHVPLVSWLIIDISQVLTSSRR